MGAAGRRALLALALLAVVLFAGRWVADFLVERWWMAAAAGPGAVFATRWGLLRMALEGGGVLLATLWFAGNLLFASRLVSRMPADEQVAVRGVPPLTGPQLRVWGLAVAALLGLLCGVGSGNEASTAVLALQRPQWGLTDAFNNRDLGFYIAVLPALTRLQFFGLGLTFLSLVAALMAYAAGGALRVTAPRFAIDPGVRLHIGLLGAAFALMLALGYLLEPYEFASGLRPATGAAHVVLLSSLSRMLIGLAAASGILTLYWALRGRIMLPVGSWAAFGLFALVIRLMAPAAGAIGEWDREEAEQRDLEREAFAIPELSRGGEVTGDTTDPIDRMNGLWEPRAIPAPPASEWVGADRLVMALGSIPRAVLILVAGSPTGGGAYVISDDAAAPGGQPLSLRDDGGFYPGAVPVLALQAHAVRPGVTGSVTESHSAGGVRAGHFLRRLLLTWSRQHNVVGQDPEARVHWRLDPRERLAAVAPFAEWGTPRPRIIDGDLLWLSDGYVYSSAFPAVAPVPWRGRPVSFLRAAFVGVVDAASGRVRVFERGATDPLSLAWVSIARDLIEPVTELPAAIAASLQFPEELFAAHAAVLRRRHWHVGALIPPLSGVSFDSLPGPVRRAGFLGVEGRRLLSVLEGERVEQSDRLRLVRFDTTLTIEAPTLLPARWERLPFVQQTRDSAGAAGWRFLPGPVRYTPIGTETLLAWQVAHAVDSAGRGSVAAVNLAYGTRLGTGPDLESARENLRGLRAAFPQDRSDQRRMEEAREWFNRADSALRQGDLSAFGRAFEALGAILHRPGG